MADSAVEKFESHLLNKYGPTISGPDLYEALGFKTYAAFHSCHQRDEIGVNVFKLPSRRGWYALTTDIAAWLFNQARIGSGDKSAPAHDAPINSKILSAKEDMDQSHFKSLEPILDHKVDSH